ncbi:unnamed protein product [Effrenium voratum]|uniref:Uncharacterized protein n=1 Tax=Effrenium voratum TaxID=2562239 RepID=A0AA36MVD3_9DINO|nr:unnamed protein product [Effrenium voratum]CAJ1425785.1 unnamed protein product [Effrenium voratum]
MLRAGVKLSCRGSAQSCFTPFLVDSVSFGSLLIIRSFSWAASVLMLDFVELGLPASLQSLVRVALALSVFGFLRTDASTLVLDFAFLGFPLSLKSSCRPDLSVLLPGRSCAGEFMPLPQHLTVGSSFPMRQLACTGFAVSILARSSFGLSPLALDHTRTDVSAVLRSFMCLDFLLPSLDTVNTGLLPAMRGPHCAELLLFVLGRARPDLSPAAADFAQLGPSTSSRAFARISSGIPVIGTFRLAPFMLPADSITMGSPSPTRCYG